MKVSLFIIIISLLVEIIVLNKEERTKIVLQA